MSATCPVCGREQDAGLLCHACTSSIERELGDVRELMAELDISISKQAKIGNGGKAGKGGTHERWPINLGASAAAWDLEQTLMKWAKEVQDRNSWFGVRPIGSAAILLRNIDYIRRHPDVAKMVEQIADAVKKGRSAIDRPAEKVYLGQCMVATPNEDGLEVTCLAELYARPNASITTCRTCGVTHEVGERRAWLLQRAADMIVTVKEASQYLGEVGGIKVSQSSIRGYLHRGKLAYRPGNIHGIRLGDLLSVVLDEGERRTA